MPISEWFRQGIVHHRFFIRFIYSKFLFGVIEDQRWWPLPMTVHRNSYASTPAAGMLTAFYNSMPARLMSEPCPS